MTAADLALRVRQARSAVDREAGEAHAIGAAGRAAEARVTVLREQSALHERVVGILTKCGEERQESAQRDIEQLVTRGLQELFGQGLSFHIVQSVRAGQANVDFVIRSQAGDKPVDTPVMDARGGGLVAVASFLLRLVVLLKTPGARPVLFLDESFAHVSAEYRPALARFLRVVADRAVQLVMVTHDEDYPDVADTRYRFTLDRDGLTQAAELAAPAE